MANRIDIELTSARGDDSYTWRAAGARQPRGVVGESLLPPGAKVGDVLRAEIEVELDGITVVSVLPPKEKSPVRGRIELLHSPAEAPGVTTVLASRGDRRRRPRRERPGAERAGSETTASRRDAREGGRRRTERGPRPGPGRRPGGVSDGEEGGDRSKGRGRAATAPGKQERRTAARFAPGRAHREELLHELTPEQRPIAERLAEGGLPAVRKALAEERARAQAEGRPVGSGEPIIAIAEELLPSVRAAVWLDRAEAAAERLDDLSLRDLRTTVLGAAPRDEAGRELAKKLRGALESRVSKLREEWEGRIASDLDEGRVLHALRGSAKPPEPTARFPGSLVQRLSEQASEAMSEETSPSRWLSLLEAALQSPVRRQVKPAGLPADPSGEVRRQARMAAGRIPALARLLGMPIPPPPQPLPGERPSGRVRPRGRPVAGERPAPEPEGGGAASSDDAVQEEEVGETVDEG